MSAVAFLKGQFKFFSDAGYDVWLVTSHGAGVAALAAAEGARYVPTPMVREMSPLRDLRSFAIILGTLRRIRPCVTIVGTPKAGLLTGVGAAVTGVPTRIYTLYGLRLETAHGWKRVMLWLAERLACAAAHQVVVVSPSLLERARQLHVLPATKGVVVASGSCNGVDVDRFSPADSATRREARTRFGLRPQHTVVGYVGRLVGDKGIGELVIAFNKLAHDRAELRLLLVGTEEAGDPLGESTRAAIGGDPRILCTGWLDDTRDAYAAMDVFVLPSYREGFPGVALEAAASGLPVVVTDVTGARDAVRAGLSGLRVPPRDPESLAEAIGALVDDVDLRCRMGRCGAEWVAREFEPSRLWAETLRLVRALEDSVRYRCFADS